MTQRLTEVDRCSLAGQTDDAQAGAGVLQPGLGPQHEHRQALEGGGQHIGRAQQPEGVRIATGNDQAGQHPALRIAVAGQTRLAGIEPVHVVAELAVQETGGIGTAGLHHAPERQAAGAATQRGGGDRRADG